MIVKQLSVFIENKGGTLIRVLELLSRSGIQIIASTVADTKDYGIYRLICNNTEKAFMILKEAGINTQLVDLFAISIDDEPGCAANAIKEISNAGVNILYLYSFLWQGRGVLAFRVDDAAKAKEVIIQHNMHILTDEDFKA
ncbi:MAG: amino acid-binding protein [Bacteroidales bacterium]|nr:amino acid-binding protein [Bacteroidales bacterium]